MSKTRALMLAVAIIAVILGVTVAARNRRNAYLRMAAWHGQKQDECQQTSYFLSPRPADPKAWAASARQWVKDAEAESKVHEALRKKYLYAADHPWISLPTVVPKTDEPEITQEEPVSLTPIVDDDLRAALNKTAGPQ